MEQNKLLSVSVAALFLLTTIAGCLGNDNTLKDYGAKHINPLNLFSLVPYFNHDKSCTKFLADNGVET